jgi:hypothetical protein
MQKQDEKNQIILIVSIYTLGHSTNASDIFLRKLDFFDTPDIGKEKKVVAMIKLR